MNIVEVQRAQMAEREQVARTGGAVIGGLSASYDWSRAERMTQRMQCLQMACSPPFVGESEQPETTTARAQKFYDFVTNPGAK